MKYLPALLSILAFPVMAATGQFNVDSLVHALIYVVIIGLIFFVVWWFIGYVGIPEPFNKVVRVIIGLVALIVLVTFLLKFLPS